MLFLMSSVKVSHVTNLNAQWDFFLTFKTLTLVNTSYILQKDWNIQVAFIQALRSVSFWMNISCFGTIFWMLFYEFVNKILIREFLRNLSYFLVLTLSSIWIQYPIKAIYCLENEVPHTMWKYSNFEIILYGNILNCY